MIVSIVALSPLKAMAGGRGDDCFPVGRRSDNLLPSRKRCDAATGREQNRREESMELLAKGEREKGPRGGASPGWGVQ